MNRIFFFTIEYELPTTVEDDAVIFVVPLFQAYYPDTGRLTAKAIEGFPWEFSDLNFHRLPSYTQPLENPTDLLEILDLLVIFFQ